MNSQIMKKLAIGIAILIGLSILLFQVIAGIAVGNVITGETRDNLTFSEAQALLPFQICLPTYIPSRLERNDRVVVKGEIKSQTEVNVRIDYVSPGSEKPIVTLKEFNLQGVRGRMDPYDEATRRRAIESLLAWLLDSDWDKVEKMTNEVIVGYEVYDINDIEHLVVEIQEPESLQSVRIYWQDGPVGYQVFTRLSAEEAKRVSDSMSICGTVPTSTP